MAVAGSMTDQSEQVVNQESATLGLPATHEFPIPIDGDHHSICKFERTTRGAYDLVIARISKLARDATAIDHAHSAFPDSRGQAHLPEFTCT